jgi:hypothetical protein
MRPARVPEIGAASRAQAQRRGPQIIATSPTVRSSPSARPRCARPDARIPGAGGCDAHLRPAARIGVQHTDWHWVAVSSFFRPFPIISLFPCRPESSPRPRLSHCALRCPHIALLHPGQRFGLPPYLAQITAPFVSTVASHLAGPNLGAPSAS